MIAIEIQIEHNSKNENDEDKNDQLCATFSSMGSDLSLVDWNRIPGIALSPWHSCSPVLCQSQFVRFANNIQPFVCNQNSMWKPHLESCGSNIFGTVPKVKKFPLEVRVNFGRPYLDLYSLPPVAIHVLFHMVPSNISQTY